MTATPDHDPHRDEIDAIVDDILAEPERAGELKSLLRRRFVLRRTAARRRDGPRDLVEFWDNVPV